MWLIFKYLAATMKIIRRPPPPRAKTQPTSDSDFTSDRLFEVEVTLSLEAKDGSCVFVYQSANERSKGRVDELGNIDLRGLEGPVFLVFRLKTSALIQNGKTYWLGFAESDSAWINEAAGDKPTGPYRGTWFADFRNGASDEPDPLRTLAFWDSNRSAAVYRYTLRVIALAESDSLILADDPEVRHDPPYNHGN